MFNHIPDHNGIIFFNEFIGIGIWLTNICLKEVECIGFVEQKRIIESHIGKFQSRADCTFILIEFEQSCLGTSNFQDPFTGNISVADKIEKKILAIPLLLTVAPQTTIRDLISHLCRNGNIQNRIAFLKSSYFLPDYHQRNLNLNLQWHHAFQYQI